MTTVYMTISLFHYYKSASEIVFQNLFGQIKVESLLQAIISSSVKLDDQITWSWRSNPTLKIYKFYFQT